MNTLSKERFIHYYSKIMTCMGLAGHFIFIFQIQKILTTKCSAGVSLEGFLIATASIASWLLYGILKNDKVLIQVNLFGFIVSILCLITIIIYK